MDQFVVVPAAYIALRRGDQVLLLLRSGTGWMDGFWAMAAGHVEAGESVQQAALREAREEVGVTIALEDLEPLCAMHRTLPTGDPIDQRVDFFFTASRWSGEPCLREPDKAADLGWFPLDALPDPVVPHEAVVLEAVRKGAVPAVLSHGFDAPGS
ncbi:MAG: NUDIX hydrolase [Kribbellaceae bacterium]